MSLDISPNFFAFLNNLPWTLILVLLALCYFREAVAEFLKNISLAILKFAQSWARKEKEVEVEEKNFRRQKSAKSTPTANQKKGSATKKKSSQKK